MTEATHSTGGGRDEEGATVGLDIAGWLCLAATRPSRLGVVSRSVPDDGSVP
jgi:hypothetical protein